MALITKENHPETTLIYSINNCVKCRQTKMILTKKNIPFIEVNIQEGDNMDEYISYLKNGTESMSMPVVVPPVSTGLVQWNDFRKDKIDELVSKLAD